MQITRLSGSVLDAKQHEEVKQPTLRPQICFLRTGEALESAKNGVITIDPSQKGWLIVRWLA